MLLLSTTFLIGGFRVQHLALLKRQMRFKAIAVIEVGSMATGVLEGIIMAWLQRNRPVSFIRNSTNYWNFLVQLARGCDNLLIGRFYGPAALGLYSRGAALMIQQIHRYNSSYTD